MKYVTSKFLMIPVLAVVLTLSAPAASTALACPMCKAATEEDDSKPRAYMYSILFMLTVPATLVSGVTFSLVKMSRKEAEALRDAGLSDESADGASPEESQG
jgi:hypothetical protein